MKKIKELSTNYLDGLITRMEYFAHLVIEMDVVFRNDVIEDDDNVSRIAAALSNMED